MKNGVAFDAGRLFAVTVTGDVVALSAASGTLLWRYVLADPSQRWVYSSPLACDGRLYAGVSSQFVALDAESGRLLWQRSDMGTDDWISSYASPAAHGDYLAVAFYTQPMTLAVLNAATGETVWSKSAGKPYYMYASPVIGDDGVLYATSGGAIRAFELESGALIWQCDIDLQRLQATPALTRERLFASTGTGVVLALDRRTGSVLWQWQVDSEVPLFTAYGRVGKTSISGPLVAAECVFVGGADGYLYGLDASTGALVWKCDVEVPLAAVPAGFG